MKLFHFLWTQSRHSFAITFQSQIFIEISGVGATEQLCPPAGCDGATGEGVLIECLRREHLHPVTVKEAWEGKWAKDGLHKNHTKQSCVDFVPLKMHC